MIKEVVSFGLPPLFHSTEDDNAVINPLRAAREFAGGAFAGAVLSGGSAAIQNTMGLLHGYRQQNYRMLQQQDGGKTADFDAQYKHYYDLGRSGFPVEQIPKYQATAPLDPLTVQDAVINGQNDGFLEALQTVRKVIECQEVSRHDMIQMLNFPETRAVTEQLMRMRLEGYPQAYELVQTWQRMYSADLQQASKLSAESMLRQDHPSAERMPTLDELAESLVGEMNGTLYPKQEIPVYTLKDLAAEIAADEQVIHNSELTPHELALQWMTDGSKGDLSMQTYKNALLSRINRGFNFDTPLYRKAAIVHRAIADNLNSLQMRQIEDVITRIITFQQIDSVSNNMTGQKNSEAERDKGSFCIKLDSVNSFPCDNITQNQLSHKFAPETSEADQIEILKEVSLIPRPCLKNKTCTKNESELS